MQKLSRPEVTFDQVFNECVDSVGNTTQRMKYRGEIGCCTSIEAAYTASAEAGTLYTFPRTVAGRGEDPFVHGALTKSDLTKLYTSYLVPKEKPARQTYELLMVSTFNKCPFCGGIGQVQTLDHYLPKANFPLFSVAPGNLVPCCRDCNSGKSNSFAETKEGQTLHPYFDNDKFFTQQWVFSHVEQSFPPAVTFYADPPDDWNEVEKSRARAHFNDYDLASRFGIEAAAELPEIIRMKQYMRDLSPTTFSELLQEKSGFVAMPINNWRRVLYSGLAADTWFCDQAF
ncbi:HNH endonuclease [Ruegeria arenilitoris]|uniref:HNH endonuclease n=1 Tax=Ruegeria arenilitoris TaxID=1173585 RepID=UPI00147CF973|nr:HNH endonuclease [Ruegeria arenilitoris]